MRVGFHIDGSDEKLLDTMETMKHTSLMQQQQ